MNKKFCIFCNKEINSKQPSFNIKKFCSRICRSNYYSTQRRDILIKEGYNIKLSTGTKGAISEFKVCVDLLEKNYEVFRAISPSCSCDLAILKGGKLLRVEVRSNNYSLKNLEPYKHKVLEKTDILAMVTPKGIMYYPKMNTLK